MALFKIVRGKSEDLPETYHDGYAYFCTDTGAFYIDYKENESDTEIKRRKISAGSADKLISSADKGSGTKPVYFKNGIPVECTYELQQTVSSDALFTDEKVKQNADGSTNAEIPILMAGKASPSSDGTDFTKYDTEITINPAENSITATKFVGNLEGGADRLVGDAGKNGQTGSSTQPVYFENGVPKATTYQLNATVPSNAKFTDTDTKVTSVSNHYAPAADSASELSADAADGNLADWNSTNIVTGVNIQRDAKGHVVGVTVDSAKMPANPNVDTNTAHEHAAGIGLAVEGESNILSGEVKYKAKLKNETPLTVDSVAPTSVGGTYPVVADKSGNLAVSAPNATASVKGVVQLTSTIDTSENKAATPKAVKTAYDLANTTKTNLENLKVSETYETKTDASAKLEEAKEYAKEYTDDKISLIMENADDITLNSIKELSEAIEENDDAIEALNSIAASKADATIVNNHINDKNNPHGVTCSQIGAAPTPHASTATTYGKGTKDNYGHVKLSSATDSTSSTSDGVAATPAAVKAAYDLAASAKTDLEGLSITANASDDDVIVLTGEGGVQSVSYSATHANSGVTAGDYTKVSVNDKGHVTSGSNPTTLGGYGITDAYTKTEINTEFNDIEGQLSSINSELDGSIKELSVSGKVIKYTRNDGTEGTITTQDTDTKVTQNAAITTAKNYPVILGYSDVTAKVTNAVNKASTLTYNPSTQILTAPTFKGNLDGIAETAEYADEAGKATNDGSDRNIVSTYETKTDSSAKLTEAKGYTDTQIGLLINDSDPATLNSIYDLGKAIEDNQDAIEALNSIAAGKADATTVNNHINNKNNPHGVTYTQVGAAPTNHASTETTYGTGTNANYGHVKLSDSVNSSSSTAGGIAATPAAVKHAYDLAAFANSAAENVDSKLSGYKTTQSAVSSPSPSTTATTTSFIDTISQNANGVISATKKPITTGTKDTKGIVQLTSTIDTSEDKAATPKAVKTAYDLANTAKTTAESKVDSLSDLGITATATELNYTDGVTSNIQTQLNKKANDYSIELYNGTDGNPKPVRFASFDYSTCVSEEGIAAKISMVSGHGNGSSYAFLQDVIIRVNHLGDVSVDNFKYYGAATDTYDGAVRQYGDIFWVIDTTNKIVDFYCLMGQYARINMTPWKRLTYSSKGTVTQYTSCTVYSSGTKVWANNSNIALTSELDSIVSTLNSTINNKVDKVSGKGLSTNDYTTTEKNKLSGIATGAEVNQNAFSNVTVGSTTIAADAKTDTLTLVAGSNITLTPDATNDKITIAANLSNYATKSDIAELPQAMIFRGSLGTNGTIKTLPDAADSTVGDVYKVITAGTYDSKAAKVGDTFVCRKISDTSFEWVLIPSGDEPNGTVTSIGTGVGLTGGTITSSGTIKAKLRSETLLTVDSAAATTGKVYPVAADKSGYLAVNVPLGSADVDGVAKVHSASNCTTYTSDNSNETCTPAAVKKAAKMFAITRPPKKDTPQTVTVNAISRWENADGDLKDSKIIIEDVTNTRDTSLKAQVIAIPAEGNKKMVYGYCTDQIDGTSFIGGVFDKDATAYPYSAGLAIGGTSGNLLWKGNVVATTNQIPTVPSSLKNPYSLTIQGNGTTLTNGTYDGSAAKTVNITPANIGAVSKAGDTMTGSLVLKPATGEGGQIHLSAASNDTTNNGIIIDTANGDFRIFGEESGTKTGVGTVLTIDPYDGTINGGYTFNGNKVITSQGLAITQADGTTGYGISLYGSASPQTYGLWFGKTATFGTHGTVSSDWATYFGMNSGATTRGWVFRREDGCVASISGAGNLSLNGHATIGNKARLQYDSTNECLNFSFV